MSTYNLYFAAQASQSIEVEADSLEEAEELAYGQVEIYANVSNNFDIGDAELQEEYSTCDGEPLLPEKALEPTSNDGELEALRRFAATIRDMVAGEYSTWDRDKKLGQPPYDKDALVRWESVHGHDVRLKCFPEFGCQLLLDPEDVIDALAELEAVSKTAS